MSEMKFRVTRYDEASLIDGGGDNIEGTLLPLRYFVEPQKRHVHPATSLAFEKWPIGKGVVFTSAHHHDGTMVFSEALADMLVECAQEYASEHPENTWTLSYMIFLPNTDHDAPGRRYPMIREQAYIFMRKS